MSRSRIRATFQERMAEEARRLKEQAKAAPGREREAFLRKARQAETGAHINEWVASPGLVPPK
jgi:hypothetical protein